MHEHRTVGREGLSSARGGQTAARGGLSSTRGGQSAAREGLSSARGGQTVARGGLSPARGGQTAACEGLRSAREAKFHQAIRHINLHVRLSLISALPILPRSHHAPSNGFD